jgi:hypothetical protein
MKLKIDDLTFEVGQTDEGGLSILVYDEFGKALHADCSPKDLARLGNAFLKEAEKYLAKPTDREIIEDVFQPYRG